MKTISTATIAGDSPITVKGLRRADRFTKMAVQAASDALIASGFARTEAETRVGIILATRFGPHVTTNEFVDGILTFGDNEASPTAFSHSVHNAAAAYIAIALDLRGPVTAVTGFNDPYPEAKALAECWLNENRVEAVLVGFAEDTSAMMADMHAHLPLPGCKAEGIAVGAEFVLLVK